VFRNPVSLFIGGVAAVILELAEPRVRSGVWDNSSFTTDPVDRLRRTGLAAMVTLYGAKSSAEAMITNVRRIHDSIEGRTPAGESYRANDPELLDWVQATASFGFLEAYCAYVRPLPLAARDLFYAEGVPAALLYGATGAPRNERDMAALFDKMRPKLERSEVLAEFLKIMRNAPIFPAPLRPVQRLLIRAAIQILPPWARELVREERGLGRAEHQLVKRIGAAADRLRLDGGPAAEACARLGLPRDYLWKAAAASPGIRSSSPS
jgi:uncharacterized protein (DUF2236 family)